MGSAVTAAFLTGATLVLPGSLSLTLHALQDYDCSLLFCNDIQSLRALPPTQPEHVPHLRGGICQVSSGGTTILYETVGYGGVQLKRMGNLPQ